MMYTFICSNCYDFYYDYTSEVKVHLITCIRKEIEYNMENRSSRQLIDYMMMIVDRIVEFRIRVNIA